MGGYSVRDTTVEGEKRENVAIHICERLYEAVIHVRPGCDLCTVHGIV